MGKERAPWTGVWSPAPHETPDTIWSTITISGSVLSATSQKIYQMYVCT